jgi:transposase
MMRFPVQRVYNARTLRPEVPERTRLRAKVQKLREQGMSYPQIAKQLGISVGTAWNIANTP